MTDSNLKLKCLLSLTISIVGFGIALTVVILDLNLASRVLVLLSAFFSGWGCCYSLNVMSGGIAE